MVLRQQQHSRGRLEDSTLSRLGLRSKTSHPPSSHTSIAIQNENFLEMYQSLPWGLTDRPHPSLLCAVYRPSRPCWIRTLFWCPRAGECHSDQENNVPKVRPCAASLRILETHFYLIQTKAKHCLRSEPFVKGQEVFFRTPGSPADTIFLRSTSSLLLTLRQM